MKGERLAAPPASQSGGEATPTADELAKLERLEAMAAKLHVEIRSKEKQIAQLAAARRSGKDACAARSMNGRIDFRFDSSPPSSPNGPEPASPKSPSAFPTDLANLSANMLSKRSLGYAPKTSARRDDESVTVDSDGTGGKSRSGGVRMRRRGSEPCLSELPELGDSFAQEGWTPHLWSLAPPAQELRATRTGWLVKLSKGGFTANWNRRYFALIGSSVRPERVLEPSTPSTLAPHPALPQPPRARPMRPIPARAAVLRCGRAARVAKALRRARRGRAACDRTGAHRDQCAAPRAHYRSPHRLWAGYARPTRSDARHAAARRG